MFRLPLSGRGRWDGASLKGIGDRYDLDSLATFIMYPSGKMPAFFPGILTEQDILDIAAFVIELR